MAAFDAAGIRVFALSYDESDALRDFRENNKITYTFLSDPDSKIIRQFGILNTLISEDDHPWFGIPFPGTYVLDSEGLITHKFFENNLALRVSPETLLSAALGEVVEVEVGELPPEQVSYEVFVEEGRLVMGSIHHLVLRLKVPSSRHIYAEPAPKGNIAVNMSVNPDPSLVLKSLLRPASETHELAGTDERFEVHHGIVELRLPMSINRPMKDITITGELSFQSCDDQLCDLPKKETFEVTVPVTAMNAPGFMNPAEKDQEKAKRDAAHFQKMMTRHEVNS